MVLIVDSGSTKSDWVLLEGTTVTKRFKTMGFNPFFHNETLIATAIKHHEGLHSVADRVKQVYYYGAGCSSDELVSIVLRGLQSVFRQAEVSVDHDLIACAYATYDDAASIACILGTGSNSCYIDQSKVYEEVPALAYILGDEGSGSYYGKKLLSAFLYKKLPTHLHTAFEEHYGLDKDTIFENVYGKPHANVYLASFMKFISDHKKDPYFKAMVVNGMKEFMDIHVCCYPGYTELPVHFIGSIGHYFEEELRDAARQLDIQVGKIIQKPIDGLVDYHIREGLLEVQLGSTG